MKVDAFWSQHTVPLVDMPDAAASFAHLEWRAAEYPLYPDLIGSWDAGPVVLDYGCGPANDMVGFLAYSDAERVIGMDCSGLALNLARQRLGLHDFDSARYELVKVDDSRPGIPLPDASVDFINCQGVLQHTTYPNSILREFGRVLKPSGQARIMVYNYDSLWLHLYVAQELQLKAWQKAALSLAEAFRRSTDGGNCPISRAYRREDFIRLCRAASLIAEFRGGYFTKIELALDWSLLDDRLGNEHRQFLNSLRMGTMDFQGYPLYDGLPAGRNGVYWVRK